jgi:hypothetical protein
MADSGRAVNEAQRGAEARYILEHPVFRDAIEGVRKGIIGQIASVKLDDRDAHTNLVLALQTLEAIERHLRRAMETGQVAEAELKSPKVRKIF